MSELVNHQQISWREFTLVLKEQKKLVVLTQDENELNYLGFAMCCHVIDEQTKVEYSLLINDNRNHKDLHRAKIKCKYLKSLHHPNLIEYLDDFTIGQYHVIQVERIYSSLLDWINDKKTNNTLSELNYVEIALQMFKVALYLNQQRFSLDLESTLPSFVVDKEMNIKLIHFIRSSAINIARIKQIFSQCLENNELFYYRIDILHSPNKCIIWQTFEYDLWAIGICLYYLSGASSQHILSYLSRQEPYRISEHLGFQTNAILYTALCDTKSFKHQPSFQHLISSLQLQQKRLEQKINQKQQCTEEEIHQQYDQMKEDFEIFSKIHKQIYDKQFDSSQDEEIHKLIVKYDQLDQLQFLQTKYHLSTKNYEEAIIICEQIIKENPECDTAYFTRGKISELQDNLEGSIGFYQKSIMVNSLNDGSYQNIGGNKMIMRKKDSIEYHLKSIQINCNNADAYYNLGLDSEISKKQKAIQSYRKVLKINQKDADAFQDLGSLYSLKSQFEKSIRLQRLSISIEEDHEKIRQLQQYKQQI